MPLEQGMPTLANASGPAGLDLSMPMGQDRPGLFNAHGTGQA